MDTYEPAPAPSPAERATLAAEALLGILRMANVLARSHCRIDLTGLEQEIGRLCATALDLPPPEGVALRPRLLSVLAELDSLAAELAEPPAAPGPPA